MTSSNPSHPSEAPLLTPSLWGAGLQCRTLGMQAFSLQQSVMGCQVREAWCVEQPGHGMNLGGWGALWVCAQGRCHQ